MATTNREVAEALREIGVLLELSGANPFKARAYENAARRVEGLSEEVSVLVAEDRLEEIPGVGQSLAEKISELVRAGRLEYLEDLRRKVPTGLMEMLRIPDLGPKKVAAVWKKLKITSVAELEKAARAGRLQELEGFGAKSEANILAGIDLT